MSQGIDAVVTTGAATVAAPGPLGRAGRGARVPWWAGVLGIYAATRLIGAVLLAWASRFQPETQRLPASIDPRTDYFVHRPLPSDPGFLGMLTNWDGQWYWRIADLQYQSFAQDPSVAAQWAWAFPPGYPMMVSGLARLLSLSFPVAALIVSLTFGALASLLVFKLVARHMGARSALAGVALLNTFVSAPLFQVAYSESLALTLIVGALLLIDQRRYHWACLCLLALGFVRLVTPPFALVAVAVAWHLRRRGALDRRNLVGLGAVAVSSVGATFAWPLLASFLAGSPLANRPGRMVEAAPLGWFGHFYRHDRVVLGLLLLAVAGLGLLAWRRSERWGVVIATWAFAYPVFLLSVVLFTTGMLRYMLLAFPLALVWIPGPRTPRPLRLAVVGGACLAGLALQAWWIRYGYIAYDTGDRILIP